MNLAAALSWIRRNAAALMLIGGFLVTAGGIVWYLGLLVGELKAEIAVDQVEEKVDDLAKQVSTLATTINELVGRDEGLEAVQKMFRPMMQCIIGLQGSITNAIAQEKDETLTEVTDICLTFADSINEIDPPPRVR